MGLSRCVPAAAGIQWLQPSVPAQPPGARPPASSACLAPASPFSTPRATRHEPRQRSWHQGGKAAAPLPWKRLVPASLGAREWGGVALFSCEEKLLGRRGAGNAVAAAGMLRAGCSSGFTPRFPSPVSMPRQSAQELPFRRFPSSRAAAGSFQPGPAELAECFVCSRAARSCRRGESAEVPAGITT